MHIPKLFERSAYPELDDELRKLLLEYNGRKVVVFVHVRLIHMSDPYDIRVLYLFSAKTDEVKGIKLSHTAHVVENIVDYGEIFANFYSRGGKLEVFRLEHRFETKSRWPY